MIFSQRLKKTTVHYIPFLLVLLLLMVAQTKIMRQYPYEMTENPPNMPVMTHH